MADKKSFSGNDLSHIKEAICVDTNRVYDSCADKDCLTDLRVYLTDCNQHILESATTVRPRCAQILNCIIEVEKVPFNKGCYSVDLTFFVKVTLDAFTCPTSLLQLRVLLHSAKNAYFTAATVTLKSLLLITFATAPTSKTLFQTQIPRQKYNVLTPLYLMHKYAECAIVATL